MNEEKGATMSPNLLTTYSNIIVIESQHIPIKTILMAQKQVPRGKICHTVECHQICEICSNSLAYLYVAYLFRL